MIAYVSEVVQNRNNKKNASKPCVMCVYLALNGMFFSQVQALMKRQHCLEQAGSLL